MEPPKSDAPKLPDMVMCGDHPSFTKPEDKVKDFKMEEKETDKTNDRIMSYARISPTASRTQRVAESGARALSDHALRLLEARRRGTPADLPQRPDLDVGAHNNRALVQAALGSFRWPPYLLAVWVLVLLLTHVLHCAVNMLERALPALRKFCQYFRTWTEESWKGEIEINQRLCPIALACVTGLLYALYFCLYAIYCVTVWSIEPLCSEVDEKHNTADVETRVVNYVNEVNSNTNSTLKQ